jgi:hypothetical protein
MKHIVGKFTLSVTLLAAGLALAASAAHAASDGLSPAAKKLEKHAARRELSDLKKYDAKGNGKLDPEELAAKKAAGKAKHDAAILKKYDANANGVLDADEEAKYNADEKAKHDAVVLKKYDHNGNGVLDPEELAVKQKNDERMQAMREARTKKSAAKTSAATPTPAPNAGSAVASGEM